MGDTPPTVRIAISPRIVRLNRIAPLFVPLLPVALYFFLRHIEIEFFPGPHSTGMSIFLLVFGAACVIAPIWFAAWAISLVPRDAADGYIEFSAQGVDYHVGPYRAQVAWAQVGSVHKVQKPRGHSTGAIWLATDKAQKLDPARVWFLRKLLGVKMAKPATLDFGLLIPLGLFGQINTIRIIKIAKEYCAHFASDPG